MDMEKSYAYYIETCGEERNSYSKTDHDAYPKYPVADAGYGSYNNYLYCEEHGMEKYI